MKTNNELTQKEVNEVLKGFKNYLKNNDKILIDENHASPFNENCYISSGAVYGVYFPNSVIKLKNEHFYYFVCIGKNEQNELGFYSALKSEYFENGHPRGFLSEYLFTPFIVINNEYFTIKKQIENAIKENENQLKILESIKIITKKDGSEFLNIEKNFIYNYKTYYNKIFELNPVINLNSDYHGFITSFEISFKGDFKIHHFLKNDDREKYTNLFDYMNPQQIYNNIILETINNKKQQILNDKNTLKNSLKIFLKLEKAKTHYQSLKNESNKNYNYYFNDFLCIKY